MKKKIIISMLMSLILGFYSFGQCNITGSAVVSDVSCNQGSDGAIDLTINGATPPLSYSWSNGDTTQNISNLVAGMYSVLVTDANSCTFSLTETVSEPTSSLSISITTINPTALDCCFNGEATANVSGGTPPYTYLWSNGDTTQTSSALGGPGSFSYDVLVTDSRGCTITQNIFIQCNLNCDQVILIDSVKTVTCKGDSSGYAKVSVNSNSIPNDSVSISWSYQGAIIKTDTNATSSSVNNLSAGVYVVTVSDFHCYSCPAVQQSVIITEPNAAVSATAVTLSEIITYCPGPNGTQIYVNGSGGVAPYTYQWDANTGNVTTQSVSNLLSGIYCAVVTDASGCISPSSCTQLLAFQPNNSPQVISNETNVSCNGQNDGAISLSISGGQSPYTFDWTGNGVVGSNPNQYGLGAGAYSVTVSDATCVTTTVSNIVINEPSSLTAAIAVTNVNCNGGATGSIDLTVTGGAVPYTYTWSNTTVTEDQTNIVAGTYTCIITDANGCSTTKSATITEPNILTATASVIQHQQTFGGADGEATVAVSGGTMPYSYLWQGLSTGYNNTLQNATQLEPDTFVVTITDANGCSAMDTVVIDAIVCESIANSYISLMPTTCSSCDGEITFEGLDTLTPYTFTYVMNSVGPNSLTFTSSSSGTFTLTSLCQGASYTNFTFTNLNTNCFSIVLGPYVLFATPDTIYASSTSCNPIDTGYFVNNLLDPTGCDSVYISTVSFLESDSIYVQASSCNVLDTGLVVLNLTNQNGCDSTYSVYTTLLISDSIYVQSSSCNVLDTGLVVLNLTNQNGCDSSYTVYTSLLASDSIYVQSSSCNVLDTGLVVLNLTNQNGCDSSYSVFTSYFQGPALEAVNDTFYLYQNTVLAESVQTNDIFDTPNFSLVVAPDNGTLVFDTLNGNFTYVPFVSFTGLDEFSYFLCDQCGACDMATVYLVISDEIPVWPGDANNDGIANNFDVLVIGQHFNEQEVARPNATTNWQAENAYAWLLNQTNGSNLAHGDCDGDGVIDSLDIQVIDSNYNLTHSKLDGTKSGATYMGLELSTDTFKVGDTLNIRIKLGTFVSPGQDVYGIAYTIDFDNNLVSDSYFELNTSQSWLSNSSNDLSYKKPLHALGQIDIAQSRIDGMNQSGYGEIATLSVVIEDDLHGKDLLALATSFSLRNVRLIDLAGEEEGIQKEDIEFVVIQEDTLTSLAILPEINFNVFPNPFEDIIEIQFEEQDDYTISIFALDGKQIYKEIISGQAIKIDFKNLDSGIYYLQINNGTSSKIEKIIKF